jgi:hypothetical protein
LSPTAVRVAIVVTMIGALLILGALAGRSERAAVHNLIVAQTITLDKYNLLHVGMSQAQVEGILGLGKGYFEPGDGNRNFQFGNADGSYANVGFVNGVVSSLSQSGLKHAAQVSSGARVATWFGVRVTSFMLEAVAWVSWFACLFAAAGLRGCSLSIKQMLVILAVLMVAGLVLRLVPLPFPLGLLVGLVVSFVILFTMIQRFTDSDPVDTVIIIIIFLVLNMIVVSVLDYGLRLGWGLHL